MADVKVTLDISDIAQKSKQLESLLQAQAASWAKVNAAQVKFDEQGQVIGATMDSINSKGQKLITTIGKEYVTVIDSAGKKTQIWLGGLKELGSTVDYTGNQFQKAFEKMRPSPTLYAGWTRISSLVHNVGNAILRFGTYRVLNFGTDSVLEAIKAARDYQIQVSLIRTISQEAQLSTSQWANGLSDLSSKLGIEFKDVASAAYDAVSNQIAQGANTFRFLENAGNLARITGSTMKDSGNILANIINTFGSAAGTQEQVVAKLFTLQDRGRIVLSEIANTYGRVAFTAEAAGVSMDEVNGAIALMTRSGVTGDDAITLLNNVMTHFLKPSEAMKKHLDEIGIGAAANVFKIKGFTGAIQVLADAVKAGVADTQQLFPDIRANRAFGFLQTRTGDLRNEISIAGGSDNEERTARAIAIRAESSADKINKALITFQNTLTQSIGNGVNSLLQQGIEGISGQKLSGAVDDQVKLKKAIEDTVQTLMRWVKVGAEIVVTMGVWRGAVGALRIATELSTFSAQRKLAIEELMRARASQNIVMTEAQAAAEIKLGRARAFAAGGGVAALGGPIGIAVVGASVLASYTAFKQVSTDAFSTAGNAMEEYRKKMDELEVDKKFTKNADSAKVFAEVLQRISRESLNGMTLELQSSSKELNNIKTKVDDTGNVIKNKMVAYFDLVRNSIQRAEQEVTKLRGQLDGSTKFKGSLGDRINDAVSKFQGQGADDITGINLVEQRIKTMQEKIASLYARGDADSIQEARKLTEQVVDLISDRYSKIQDLNNKHQAAAAANPEALQGTGFTGKVDPSALSRELSEWQARVSAMEDSTSAKDKNRIATLELSIAEQKAADARAQDAVKNFENFSIYDKGGSVKNEFQTSGKLDLLKAKAGYQKVKDELNATLNKDVMKRMEGGGLDLQESLQTQANQQAQLLGALEKHKALQTAQQEAVAANETAIKSQDAAATSLKKWGEDVVNTTAKAEAMATVLGKINEGMGKLANTGLAQKDGASFFGAFGRGLGMVGDFVIPDGVDPARDQALKDEQDIKDKVAAVVKRIRESAGKTVNKFGKVVPDIGETRGIQQDLLVIQNTLSKRASDLGEKLSGGGINKDVAKPLEDKLTELEKMLRDFESLQKDLVRLEAEQAANEQLLTASSNAEKLAVEMNNAKLAGEALFGTAIGQGAKNAKVEVDNLKASIEALNRAASEKTGSLPGIPIEGKAYGGPIGSDNIPIMAKAGEIVSTSEASNQFYSQILAMNAQARTPQHFSGGGQVGGPVTVNVNESKTPRITGREVERIFKRHQRQKGNRR